MNWYVILVTNHPILMAIVQFSILGTFGEIISKWIIKRRFYMPFTVAIFISKMITWAILGVCIKYAFTGMKGFVNELVKHNLLPQSFMNKGIIRAFGLSFFANIQFGLFLVIFHRILDNLFLSIKNWKGLDNALLSLLWFWIPAHTITFSLPKEFQIGLAALWSIVLGVILGFYNRK